MKNIKIIFPVIALFIFSSFAYGWYPYKWYELNTKTNQTINYLNSNYGFCNYGLCNNGVFILWDDLRSKWNASKLTTNDNLMSSFGSIMCGQNGALYKTTNNGSNWNYYYLGINQNLNSIYGQQYSASGINFFTAGDNGKIYSSTNAGVSWDEMNSVTSNKLNSICFVNSSGKITNTGLIAGDNGTILRFTDFATGWKLVNSPFTENLNCITFADSMKAFVVGNNGLLACSKDLGNTWTQINLNTNANLKTVFLTHNDGSYPRSYFGIIGGDNGTCFISTNTGITWTMENTSYNYNFRGCSILTNTQEYYLAGENGKLLFRTFDSLYWRCYSFMPNNIKTAVVNDGVFNSNQYYMYSAGPGLMWPKDSLTYAVYTSGINIFANVNNIRKMATASYSGEYKPGSCSNGIINADSKFKLYKVKKGESPQNYDYANWDKMVPYGAPFYDRNHNGVYEPGIDLPGVRGADETVFLCMTDADPLTHSSSKGFGGGTPPLFAEVHVTMWGYNNGKMKDVTFMKYEIINKSPQGNQFIWDSTYTGFFYDPDIGWAFDNYMGSDSTRNLIFGYSAIDSAQFYGKNPPAVGLNILKGIKLNSVIKRMTSAIRLHHMDNDPIRCEIEPEGRLGPAINVMKGYKNDGTKWVIPNTNPPQITKFTFKGDPETNTGWTPLVGRVSNCGDSLTGAILPEYKSDIKFIACTGDDNLKMFPGDTQIVIAAQLIARGYNNLNSVTRLKELSDSVQAYFDAGFPVNDSTIELPSGYLLSQNYPNPFNASTRIKFYLPNPDYVTIKIYDVTGREIAKIINGYFNPGRYDVLWDAKGYSSGVYFYRFVSSGLNEVKKMVLIK